MDGLFITGTDTEIGKTLIVAILSLGLRKQGLNVCPVKPIATGGVLDEGVLVSPDALIYRRISGIYEPATALSPFCYRHPASPHLAAEMENRPIKPEAVKEALHSLAKKYAALLVEGIGGWLVPITYSYKVADFARDLRLPVLLVSANRLGTINHTLLTLESIRARGLNPAGVIFTHPTPSSDSSIEKNNIETIRRVGQIDILGAVPHLGRNAERTETSDSLWLRVKDTIQWPKILHVLRIA